MRKFYGRSNELGQLERRFKSDHFECMVIYGRRRVGKTALINEFCKDKKAVFFSALNTTAKENLEAFSNAIMNYERPGMSNVPLFPDYNAVFSELTALSESERLIVIIDEYPYLAKAYPAVSSMLQHLIDHKWQDSRMFLILCGSSMNFMENQVLGQESPLYGRRTGQIKVLPMDYRESAVFHPELSCEDNALIYGITGGVPHYINKLDVRGDIDEALLQNLFDRSAYLYEEPGNLLKQELREPAVYNALIKAVAEGSTKANDVATKTMTESSLVATHLKTLIELGIIRRETPITEKPGKRTIYVLADNFFRFWYRFVPRNASAVNSGRIAEAYPHAVKRYFPDYMGFIFEQMCKEYLLRYADNLPIELNEVGRWWGTDAVRKMQVEIDIIGTPVDGHAYLIGSCKYRNEKIGTDELELMRSYAAAFGKGDRYFYYIFSKGGFTQGLLDAAMEGDVTLVSLEDMFS